MTRLDAYLVERGLVPSRARAKRAIREGWVAVDGRLATKPSATVPFGARVEVRERSSLPAGYHKLASIQARHPLVFPGARVLDVGTSAGGFARWCLDAGCALTCVEASLEFAPALSDLAARGARIFQMDAFHPDLAALGGPFDLLAWDVTTEPQPSLGAMLTFLPLLGHRGRALFVAKGKINQDDASPAGWVAECLPPGWRVEAALGSRLHETYFIVAPVVYEAAQPEGGPNPLDEDVLALVRQALRSLGEDEPVEYAVLRACRELHRPDHLEWFVRAMAPIATCARERGEGWEQAARYLATTGEKPGEKSPNGGDGQAYASLKDMPEPLRGEVWDRLHHDRRGSRHTRK